MLDTPSEVLPCILPLRVTPRPRAVVLFLSALALVCGLAALPRAARAQAVAPHASSSPMLPVSAARVRNARAFCRAERQYDLARLPLSAELFAFSAVSLAFALDRPRGVEFTPHQSVAFAAWSGFAMAGGLSFFDGVIPSDPMHDRCARLVGASERLLAREPRLVTDVEDVIRARPSWPRIPWLAIVAGLGGLITLLPFDSLSLEHAGYTALGALAAAAITLPIDLLVTPGEGAIARRFQASLPSLSMGLSGIALTTRF